MQVTNKFDYQLWEGKWLNLVAIFSRYMAEKTLGASSVYWMNEERTSVEEQMKWKHFNGSVIRRRYTTCIQQMPG